MKLKVFNTYNKLFYLSFNQNNIAFMIVNVYCTIIESEKVVNHWKTGQKPNIFADHLSQMLVCIRNGILPHLWGINLSHIYAREVR